MKAYEAKQEEKRQRLLTRAEQVKSEANSLYSNASALAQIIPFGQPILVGHHSERKDRSFRNKLRAKFSRAFELQKHAEKLEQRALSIGGAGVSSDDPNAIPKLKEKVMELEKNQELMRKVNSVIGAFGRIRKRGLAWKLEGLEEKQKARLRELGLPEKAVEGLLKPDYCGRIGFPEFALTNNSATIRATKKRIEALERKAEAFKDFPETAFLGDIRVLLNVEANRVQIFFPGKPEDEQRQRLKANGFRWAPSLGCWQRHLNQISSIHAARALNVPPSSLVFGEDFSHLYSHLVGGSHV